MIRVAHLIPALDVGGAETLLAGFARHHDRGNITMRVATFRSGDALRETIAAEGVRVDRIAPRGLAGWISENEIDILHSHLRRADLLAGAAAKAGMRAKWVTTRHNVRTFRGLRRLYGWIDRGYRRHAHAIVAVSEAVADEFRADDPTSSERVVVIHNGVEIGEDPEHDAERRSRLRRSLGLPPDVPCLVHVGSLTEQKGHGTLLEALRTLHDRRLSVHLTCFGEGPLRGFLDARSRKFGLDPFVHWRGIDPDARSKLAAFDAFVFPSHWEGFGLALVEAMAEGLPVIATDVDGIREIVEPERSGVLVPPRDAEALASAVRGVLADPTRGARLGAAARERAKHFDIRRTVRAYEDTYRRAIDSDHGTATRGT